MRKKHDYTLDDIQKMTGIKRGTYSNYENGNTEPKLETWKKLADFFDVPVSYLQGVDATNKKNPCDYCNFSKRNRAEYPLYIGDTCVGYAYLNGNKGITIDLIKVGALIKTRKTVKNCPNCGRDLKNEKR